MKKTAQDQLIDLWMNDLDFRARFRADAPAAVKSTGIELSEAEMAVLQRLESNATEQQLQERLSKSPVSPTDHC